MKLTEEQKEWLKENDWDLISNDRGNFTFIALTPEDGAIFDGLREHFSLTGELDEISMLIVGTCHIKS